MNDSEIKSILLDDSLTAREKYFKVYGLDVSRDKAWTGIKKLLNKFGIVKKKNCNESATVVLNQDGSQVSECRFMCSSEDLRNPEFLLVKHGYNPKEFTLVSAKSSMWDGNTKEGLKALYSSKITVKPIDYSKDIESLVNKAVENISKPEFDVEFTCGRDACKVSFEVCLSDLHLGLTTADGDEDNFETLRERLNDIYSHIAYSKEELNTVYISFLGDVFHYDTKSKTTTAGTQQDSSISFDAMYSEAIAVFKSFFSSLLNLGIEVNVVYVPGNHDYILGYTFTKVLEALFSNVPQIHFDTAQKPRKFVMIENNLIGYIHGDMPAKNAVKWIYNDAKEYLSGCKDIEIHAGHFHTEKTVEEGNVKLRYLPTSSSCSPWEEEQGYTHKRNIELFVWSYSGLETIHYF